MDKILVIRLSSLGDVLLTTPALRVLKRTYPQSKIDFLTKAAFESVLAGNPNVSNVLTLRHGRAIELLGLRSRILADYDLIVDLHGNLRSRLLTLGACRARVVRYDKKAIQRRLLVAGKLNLLKEALPVPLRYLAALETLGVKDDGAGLDFYGTHESRHKAHDLFGRYQIAEADAVALAPGAHWATKQWPIERFRELIALLPEQRFVLLGGLNERAVGEKIASGSGKRVVNLMGETDPAVAGEVLRLCRALVTNDSGLMHLGCAAGLPVAALFGSTVKEFGFFPFRAKSLVFEKALDCRPCTTKGRSSCKKGTLECLASISAADVAEGLKTLLAS